MDVRSPSGRPFLLMNSSSGPAADKLYGIFYKRMDKMIEGQEGEVWDKLQNDKKMSKN